mgnify:CR=1 FL=1
MALEIFSMKANILIFGFLGVILYVLPIVPVSANPLPEQGTVFSFDKQKHGHHLHCELNKHHLSNIYCPHSITKRNKRKPMIASDCGGKTSGTLLTFAAYNTSVFSSDTVYFNVELALTSRKFTCTSYGFGFFLPDQIDHPPQTV